MTQISTKDFRKILLCFTDLSALWVTICKKSGANLCDKSAYDVHTKNPSTKHQSSSAIDKPLKFLGNCNSIKWAWQPHPYCIPRYPLPISEVSHSTVAP